MPTEIMPVGFVSHGAPTLATDAVRGAEFTRWATTLGRPRAVLVVSAHWLDAPPTLGTTTTRELLYDFGGFPDELYHLRYAAPAAADLAAKLTTRLPGLHQDPARPWDHGVWVPLLHMLPAADVPVLQLSLPYEWSPRRLFDLGRQLGFLREDGVLVLGSGGMVHNLARLDWRGTNQPPAWATEFEGWVRERLIARDFDAIVAFRERAPAVRLAHPTDDHFLPLLVATGAAADRTGSVRFPIEGFEYGSLSRLAVQFG
jgi:4,5-DOPA dioxygenase extradiol